MKCTNKFLTSIISVLIIMSLTACGTKEYQLKYGETSMPEAYNIDSSENEAISVDLFASDLCATASDITDSSTIAYEGLNSACVYDLSTKDVLFSYNANERVNPASLTKVMTALITLDYASQEGHSLDEMVTVGDVTINEEGVQTFGLKEGYNISLRDLLNITVIYSGNDAALALAIYIGGSEADFVNMMNEKAIELGATNTSFANPHGLSNEKHYTTAYDLYLIFNAAIKYDEFVNIINTTSTTVSFTNNDAELVEKTVNTTNKFLTGDYSSPSTIAIVGGKTGSTAAAGKCIIVYGKDQDDDQYICVIMGASDEATLYNSMTQLINESAN